MSRSRKPDYPNRRHIDLDLRPERQRRRNLNRVSLSTAAIFAVIVLGTLWLPRLLDGGASPSPDGHEPVPGAISVDVVRIIDGDTLQVRSAGTEITVRLYGVDTPERGDRCYVEATERLRTLASEQVQLLPDARLTDSFGRELRYVYALDGTLIDEALVAEGYGFAWTDDGALRGRIMAAEAEAEAAGRGCLWRGG